MLTVATYFTYGAISSINVGGSKRAQSNWRLNGFHDVDEMDLACIGGSASWDNPLQFAAFCQEYVLLISRRFVFFFVFY